MNKALSILIRNFKVYVAITKGDVDYAIEFEGKLLRVLLTKAYYSSKHKNYILRANKVLNGERVILNFDIVAAYAGSIVWLIPYSDLPLCSSTTLSDKYDVYKVNIVDPVEPTELKKVKEVKLNEILTEKKVAIVLDKEEQKRVEELLSKK